MGSRTGRAALDLVLGLQLVACLGLDDALQLDDGRAGSGSTLDSCSATGSGLDDGLNPEACHPVRARARLSGSKPCHGIDSGLGLDAGLDLVPDHAASPWSTTERSTAASTTASTSTGRSTSIGCSTAASIS